MSLSPERLPRPFYLQEMKIVKTSLERDVDKVPPREIINKSPALIPVPSRRLLGPKAAAKYLGICEDTLKKMTDLDQIRAFNMNGRRAYRLEDLEAFIESLPGWYDALGEKSAKVVEKGKP